MKRVSFLLCAALVLAAPSFSFAADPAGDWQGAIANMLHVILHVQKTPTGGYVVRLESPDQGKFYLDADHVDISESHMAFKIGSINGRYEGKWDDEKRAWEGFWTQGEIVPLELKRLDADKVASATTRNRPQEQAIEGGPKPYRAREVTFDGGAADVRIAGTLTVPDIEGPLPSVILIAGSGPQNRDEEVAGHKVFLVLSDALTRAGIAVLRYDKRGVGASTGNYAEATTDDFITDAEAALKWLSGQSMIDKARIGLLGHSEGGLIAPAIAARNPNLAFIVLMAAPGLRGDKIITMQNELIARASGVSEAEIKTVADNSARIFEIVLKSSDRAQAARQVQAFLTPYVTSGQMPAEWAKATLDSATSPWGYFFLRYDPAPMLARVTVPTLAINGTLDLQVSAKANLDVLAASLAGNRNVTIRALPSLNHLFQTARNGSLEEYGTIEETISPIALELVQGWVLERLGAR